MSAAAAECHVSGSTKDPHAWHSGMCSFSPKDLTLASAVKAEEEAERGQGDKKDGRMDVHQVGKRPQMSPETALLFKFLGSLI